MQATAAQRALPVTHGVLPQPELTGPFDVVTLIDVIEHAPDPVDLLRRIKRVMAPDGICLVVTPDVSSVAARAMGGKWWRFRAAHIGYSTSRRLPWRWRRRGCASTRLHGRRGACLRATWPNGRSATSLGRFVRLCLQFWIELLSRSICMIRFWPSADTALKRRRPQRHPRSERPLALKGAIPVTSGQTSFRSNCAGSDKTHVVTNSRSSCAVCDRRKSYLGITNR